MPIEPYKTIYKDAVKAIEGQTVECEIIVSKQEIEPYINKGKLINYGVGVASGDVVWFCDADFIPEPTLLERMQNKLSQCDVIYPMFYSKKYKALKIADGGAFLKKSVLNKYGGFPETLFGISWVTFPFLRWCMDNTNFHCSSEFVVDINPAPQRTAGKRHAKTSSNLRQLYRETVKDLQVMGACP
jgi:glycosyltransferase involved in cell wall biosynthesis